MRASQQAPDKEPCQHPPQRGDGGRTMKEKPQPPQASSQPGSEREEPKEGSRKQQVPGPTNSQSTRPRTQGRDEPRRAAETVNAAHKRLRHRRPEAHSH